MEMAVHVSFVLVVRVLWTKQDGAERTCEMLDVIFLIWKNEMPKSGMRGEDASALVNVSLDQSKLD
jgi:hypothetical protein